MTMAKLAAIAGVSVSTVSKAFSGSKEISEKKRDEIFAIAKKEGCFEKFCKTSYAGPVVGVICPEFRSDYYSELLFSLQQEIKKYGALTIVGCTDFENKTKETLLSYFTECIKVDGVIMLCSCESKNKHSIPIVALGENGNIDSVHISDEKAIDEVIKYLQKNGHKDIAFLGENYTTERLKNFRKAMEHNSMPINEDYIITDSNRFEKAGYIGMNKLFSLKNPPTAVLAAYDNIAIGAMKSISQHGKKIPDDISLIGIDNISKTSFLPVALSSITSYNEDLCQIMVRVLFDRIKDPKSKAHKSIKITKEFVKRASVGKSSRE